MDDIHITVHHKAHWEWVVPRAGDRVADDDETIQPDPLHPEQVRVKRLVPESNATQIIISGESAARMAKEYALANGADTATPRHLHAIVGKHVEDSLRDDHAPVEHWHRIEASDPKLQRALHARFIGDE